MPLVVQPLRRLSPVEKYAVDLVFDGAVDPEELSVKVPDRITIGGHAIPSVYNDDGRIAISHIKHADAEDLHMLTAVDDIDKTRPSTLSNKLWLCVMIKSFDFLPCVIESKLPVDPDLLSISRFNPSVDLSF